MTNTEIAAGMFDYFAQLTEVWITADGQVFTQKAFAEAHSQAVFNGAAPDHILRSDVEAKVKDEAKVEVKDEAEGEVKAKTKKK